jgi:hypothetical protein
VLCITLYVEGDVGSIQFAGGADGRCKCGDISLNGLEIWRLALSMATWRYGRSL